jgi:cobalamin biosynthesis Mg chelatase CobN
VPKKNALGSDPFEWLKKDDTKENAESQKSDTGDQKEQSGKSLESKDVGEISEKSRTQGSKTTGSSNIEKALKLNEIKYDPASVSGMNKLQEEETFVPRDITEVNRKAVLGKDAYAHQASSHKATQKDSPAAAFVIVYTVLLLILGFIIYKDFTKQINRLETKLELVEKKLDGVVIDYEDTAPDGGW